MEEDERELPEDYRRIRGSDASQTFSSILGYSLADYVREDERPSNRVIVRVHDEIVVGVIWLELRPDALFVEHLARDEDNSWPGLGSEMLAALDVIARRLARTCIRLEALAEPSLVRWYESNGYEKDGPAVTADGWKLQPMRKELA
ncbi:MAG TPA: GNAT family N-acetyltransferase [Candidatus Thermoplasmatota archaeon]|nr:GNAT family N-acetyltransferase [Candidatus Thermoplasmatota archaeon]